MDGKVTSEAPSREPGLSTEGGRTIMVDEPQHVPLLSQLFGFGAMVPFLAAAIAVWTTSGLVKAVAANLGILWGGAILLFLAGVRRGVSFRTPGGPTAGQIAVMLWLFLLGFLALLSPFVPVTPVAVGPQVLSYGLLVVGFASLMVLDPLAAGKGEAPLFFNRLRPVQMAIAVAALAALFLEAL